MSENIPHALDVFMSQITDEMASEYKRIYSRTTEDPGTAGDEGEENWASILREWLPPNYHVRTKGRLITHDGQTSPQIDVIVLKPSYPIKLLEKRIWLANGVAAVFECKNTVKSADIEASARRCEKFKSLYSARSGTPYRELRSPLIYGLLSHSHNWKKNSSTPLVSVFHAFDRGSSDIKEPRLLMDLICVAELGNWSSMLSSYYRASWADEASAKDLEKLFGGDYGVYTTMICASPLIKGERGHFTPIGSFISKLIQLLAWQDHGIRDFADYYRLSGMWGSGSGPMRFWSTSVLSSDVRLGISQGLLTNGEFWNEWSVIL